MTALAANKARSFETWGSKEFTLTSGLIAYKHAALFLNPATGKVVLATSSGGLIFIGFAAEKVDASAADKSINVDLASELRLDWFANGTSAAVAADVGKDCFFEDDQTVTMAPASKSFAGRVMAVSSTRGVLVDTGALPQRRHLTATPAIAANNINIADNPNDGAVFEIPTTAANITVTLPATCKGLPRVSFWADGTKNGHTVTYRDATGPSNLTAALTASKKHMKSFVFTGTLWFCDSDVSP